MALTIDPVLLHVYNHRIIQGWQCQSTDVYASIKYDGWRMIWMPNGSGQCFTRQGSPIEVSANIKCILKKYAETTVIDGELWGGYGTQSSDITAGRGSRYMIFDCPEIAGTYAQRYNHLKSLFALMTPDEQLCISVVEQHQIPNNHQTDSILTKMMIDEVSRGGEGIVIRNPLSKYEFGSRSTNIIKLKPNDIIEATVIGWSECDSITTYTKSLICLTNSDFADNGIPVEFRVTFKNEHPPPIGTIIRVKHSQTTAKGLPKFPAYLGVVSSHSIIPTLALVFAPALAPTLVPAFVPALVPAIKPKFTLKSNDFLKIGTKTYTELDSDSGSDVDIRCLPTLPVSSDQIRIPKKFKLSSKFDSKLSSKLLNITTSQSVVKISEINAINALKLYPKQSIKLDNGKGKYYTLTAPSKGGRIYCTCDAWKYQKLHPSQRMCKHTQMINGGWSNTISIQ